MEADLAAHQHRVQLSYPGRNLDLVGEEGGTTLAIFRRIVGNPHGDPVDARARLVRAQPAGVWTPVERHGRAPPVVRVHEGAADAHKVGQIPDDPKTDEIGELVDETARWQEQWDIDSGHEGCGRAAVRHIVELDPVEGRLAKGHGRQGRADLVADAHAEVVLPLGVCRDHEGAKKVLVPVGLVEQVTLRSPGLALLPVVDQPTSGQEPAVEVVVIVALLIGG